MKYTGKLKYSNFFCIIINPPAQNNFGLQSCFVLKRICIQQDIGTLKYNRHKEKRHNYIISHSHSFFSLIQVRVLVVIEGVPPFDNIYPMSDFDCMYSKVLATMSLEESRLGLQLHVLKSFGNNVLRRK